jgi:hypothetical protein
MIACTTHWEFKQAKEKEVVIKEKERITITQLEE